MTPKEQTFFPGAQQSTLPALPNKSLPVLCLVLPSAATRAGGAAGTRAWLCSVAARVVLTPLLWWHLCRFAVIGHGCGYCSSGWEILVGVAFVSYREFALHREKALSHDTVCAEIPQWVFWSVFTCPGNCRWSILWSQAMPPNPWWSLRKNRNSSCITGFSNACVKLTCVRLGRYFLPAGLNSSLFPLPFLLALLFKFYLDFWEPVQFWTEKQFSDCALCNAGHLLVQQCTARHWNICVNGNLHGGLLPSPDFCQSECHGDNFWSFLPGGVGRGRHSREVGVVGAYVKDPRISKYGPMIDDVTWLSERLMLMARMSAGMAGLWGEKSWRTGW